MEDRDAVGPQFVVCAAALGTDALHFAEADECNDGFMGLEKALTSYATREI